MADINLALSSGSAKAGFTPAPSEKIKPGQPAPDAPKEKSIWDTKFQPIIDKNEGYDEVVNYSNSLHMMRAINGRYDKLLNSSDVDSKIKQNIMTLKNSSWAAMNEMVKLSKGQGDPELFVKYRKNANAADEALAISLDPNKKKNYAYDNKTKKIMDFEEFKKFYDGIRSRERGSTQANAGGGGVNPFAGYLQLKNYTQQSMDSVKNKVNPLISTWTENAFTLFNSDDKAAGRFDPDNRTRTLNVSIDVLKFVGKYGTKSGNRKIDNQMKDKASDLLAKLNNPDLSRDEQMALLKKSTSGDSNLITDMVQNMGYYGSNFIYNRHKTTLGSNEKYYEGGMEKYKDKIDDIDYFIDEVETFKTQSKEDKREAWREALAHSQTPAKQLIFQAAINRDGVIRSYDQFLKALDADHGNGKRNMNEKYSNYVYNRNRGFFDDKRQFFTEDQTNEDYHETMRELYNSTVKDYKKTFSDLNKPKMFKGKIIHEAGGGNTADKVLAIESLDLSLDKNGNIIHAENYKGKLASDIFSLIMNKDGSVNDTDITLLGNSSIKAGYHKTASKEVLRAARTANEKTFKEFFKGQDLSKMDIEFDRNSSLDYHATYTFINKKTDKQLVMIAPASYLDKNKETFWRETRMTSSEYRFQKLGKKKLPDKDNMYKNAIIYNDNGIKTAEYKYIGTDGLTKTAKIPLGNLEIDEAVKYFNDYVYELKKLKQQSNFKD